MGKWNFCIQDHWIYIQALMSLISRKSIHYLQATVGTCELCKQFRSVLVLPHCASWDLLSDVSQQREDKLHRWLYKVLLLFFFNSHPSAFGSTMIVTFCSNICIVLFFFFRLSKSKQLRLTISREVIIAFLCFAIAVPGILLKMALYSTGESHCPGTGEAVLDEICRNCNKETLPLWDQRRMEIQR